MSQLFTAGLTDNNEMAIVFDNTLLTFEYTCETGYVRFKRKDGSTFARTYKSAKTKIAKELGIPMTGGSAGACQFMDALNYARACYNRQ
jgi:hypothetical protein